MFFAIRGRLDEISSVLSMVLLLVCRDFPLNFAIRGRSCEEPSARRVPDSQKEKWTKESLARPGRAPNSPGEPKWTQESPARPRRIPDSPGEPQKQRESRNSQGEPKRAQESPKREAQESPRQLKRAMMGQGEP